LFTRGKKNPTDLTEKSSKAMHFEQHLTVEADDDKPMRSRHRHTTTGLSLVSLLTMTKR
jgi:hypothetical protein